MIQGGHSFSGYERDAAYLNLDNRRYLDISGISGIDSVSDGRGAVYADFDNDGDLDVFLTTIQGAAHLLFRNNIGQDSNWVRVTLDGTDSGRDAYGAVVRCKTSAGIQTQIKAGGQGYLSQHDPRLLFGLGTDARAEWIEVTWPSGQRSHFRDIPAGSSLSVTEGKGSFTLLSEQPRKLPDPIELEDRRLRPLRVREGEAFPDIEVLTLSGEKKSLGSVFAPGKRVLLNLWATWCSLCDREMPELERLLPQLSAIEIDVIGLSIDTGELEAVRSYARDRGVSYPILLGGEKAIEAIYPGEEVWVPLTILFDRDGKVLEIFSGYSEVIRELERLTRE